MSLLFNRFNAKCLFITLFFLTSCLSHSSEILTSDSVEYEVQRDSVWIKTSNGIIFGIVFKPIGAEKKVPAVLCLQGGGNVGLANYLYEAEFFAKNGIVALVCDKSGSGLSKTKKSWTQQSFKDKTKEYYELFGWLSNRSDVISNKVGIHGMSEGGRLALNLAIEFPNKIAFVNAVSGPIESFKKNQLYAIRHYLLARTTDSTHVEKAIRIWDTYFNEVGLGKISEETINRVNELRKLNTEIDYLPNNSINLPSRPLPQDIHFTQENKIKSIKCPVLFQYGELDILVNPKRSISLIPKDSKFVVKYYTKTDHSMNLQNGDIHPSFLLDKKEWINTSLAL